MHAISRFGNKSDWIIVPPAPYSDDVLVVEEEAFSFAGYAKEATTKTSSLSGAGRRNYSVAYISKTTCRMRFGPSPFDSAPRTLRDMKLSFLGGLPPLINLLLWGLNV